MLMSNVTWQPQRVVVGVDGSECSIVALRWAAALCVGTDAKIEATICWQYPASTGGLYEIPVGWDPSSDAATGLDAAIVSAFGTQPPPGLLARVLPGHPARALVDASDGADLLVVGTRGHGGFAGLLLGSVSAYCAEHATCPVTVTH